METQFFKQGIRGCFVILLGVLLAISAMTLSLKHLYREAQACHGMLGAGYPVLFICDAWGGGSPTGSWDNIDLVDVLNGGIRPGGFLVDFLCYLSIIWVVWVVASLVFHFNSAHGTLWWVAFIGVGFITGLLFAFLIITSSDLYIRHPDLGTATPVLTSPTSLQATPVEVP